MSWLVKGGENDSMTALKFKRGFTLIELLIVMAILGVLAVVVLVAINPNEQLKRARDAGRITALTQLGHNLEAYATSHNGLYVTEANDWISSATAGLVGAGEIQTTPAEITYSDSSLVACDGTGEGIENGWCYDYDATTTESVIAFARMESDSNQSLCTTAGDIGWFVYASAAGRGGVYCDANEPTAAGFDASNFAN